MKMAEKRQKSKEVDWRLWFLRALTVDQSQLPEMEDLSGTPWREDDKQRKKKEGWDTETSTKIVGKVGTL